MSAVTVVCPNEDCEMEHEVWVRQTAAARPARIHPVDLSYPAEDAEYEVDGLSVCTKCGADMDTDDLHQDAIEKAIAASWWDR